MATVDKLKEQLKALLPALEARKAEVLQKLATAYAKRDALIAKIQPLEAELRALQKEVIKPGEEPIRECGRQIAEIHRVLGAKTLRGG